MQDTAGGLEKKSDKLSMKVFLQSRIVGTICLVLIMLVFGIPLTNASNFCKTHSVVTYRETPRVVYMDVDVSKAVENGVTKYICRFSEKSMDWLFKGDVYAPLTKIFDKLPEWVKDGAVVKFNATTYDMYAKINMKNAPPYTQLFEPLTYVALVSDSKEVPYALNSDFMTQTIGEDDKTVFRSKFDGLWSVSVDFAYTTWMVAIIAIGLVLGAIMAGLYRKWRSKDKTAEGDKAV